MDGRAPRGLVPPLRGTNEANIPTEQPTTETDARLPRPHGHSRRTAGAEAPAGQRAQTADGQHTAETTVLKQEFVDQRLPRSRRIRKRSEFLRLQRGSGRAGRAFVVITAASSRGRSRLGITASRKVGGAVVRNRVKRRVREVFRRHQQRLQPPRDVVVIVRPSAAGASYAELERELCAALKIASAQ